MRTMVSVVACVLVVATTAAHADPHADIAALVKTEVDGLVDEKIHAPPMTADVVEISPQHFSMNRLMNFYGGLAHGFVQKLGPVTVGVDATGRIAWYHATIEADYTTTVCADGCAGADPGHEEKRHQTWHISGVARADDGRAWKLAVIMWSGAIADKELLSHVVPSDGARVPPAIDGDAASARLVAGWLGGGGKLVDGESANAATVASGTAPTEIGVGPAAARKLAAGWDALHLWCGKANGLLLPGGAVAFVHADVYLPSTKPKGDVKMELGAVIVKEAAGWRWVSLSFKPDDNPQQ